MGPDWVVRYVAPALATMAVGGGVCWAGLRAAAEAGESAWRPAARAAAAAGLFAVVMGMVEVSRTLALHQVAILIFELSIFAAAIWKGGWRERTVAAFNPAYFIIVGLAGNLGWFGAFDYPEVAWRSVCLTLVQLVILAPVVVRAQRYWVLWAASIELLALTIALMAALGGGIGGWTWLVANNFWALAFDGVVLFGIYQAWLERDPPSAVPARTWRLAVFVPTPVPAGSDVRS